MTDEERYYAMCDEIYTLKADNKKLAEELSRCTSGNGTYISIESHNRYVAQLKSRAEQAEARTEAAVKDLELTRNCVTCAHKGKSGLSEPCLNCQGTGYSNWQWRGVQGEDK